MLENETLPAPAQSLQTEAVPPPAGPLSPAPAGIPSPFREVAEAKVPAVLLPPVTAEGPSDPASVWLIDNLDQVSEILGLYTAQDNSTVVYNPTVVPAEALQKADAEGTLAEVLPSLQTPQAAEQAAPAGGSQDLVAMRADANVAPTTGQATAPTPGTGAQPADPKLQRQRAQALSPKPGQPPRILEALRKRAF